jgi:hypothetical protein
LSSSSSNSNTDIADEYFSQYRQKLENNTELDQAVITRRINAYLTIRERWPRLFKACWSSGPYPDNDAVKEQLERVMERYLNCRPGAFDLLRN